MSRQQPPTSRNRQPCDLPCEDSTSSFWHSQPSPLLTAHRTTRELPKTAEVVIIGSGMTGTSAAYHLFEEAKVNGKEIDVVMLEAREACWGATGRNGGHCQPSLFDHPHDPSIGHFELANFRTIQSLIESKNIDCEFVVQPAVRAIYDKRTLDEIELALLKVKETAPELAEMMKLVTKKAELLDLRLPTAIAALVSSVGARMWPYKFVARILEDVLTQEDLKGTFNLQTLTPVEALNAYDDHSGRWLVATPRGSITASKVILATNAYTSHILPSFADLIVPVRGQMSALEPLHFVKSKNRLQTSFGFMGEGLDDYLIQRPNETGGQLMFGGGRQHGPTVGITDDSVVDQKIAEYLRTRLLNALGRRREETFELGCETCRVRKKVCNHKPDKERCQACVIGNFACRPQRPERSPYAQFPATNEWTGIMGYSRDDHPWIGPVPDKPNLYIAAGYTGHGMPNTWLCGKAVALMAFNALDRPQDSVQSEAAGFEAAEVGMPEAYLVSKERIQRAMECEDVETRDGAEMERARRKEYSDRPHSGYA